MYQFDAEAEGSKTRSKNDDAWIDPNPLPIMFPYTQAEQSRFLFGSRSDPRPWPGILFQQDSDLDDLWRFWGWH